MQQNKPTHIEGYVDSINFLMMKVTWDHILFTLFWVYLFFLVWILFVNIWDSNLLGLII